MDGATTHGYDILRASGRKGGTMSVRMFQARLECDRETLGRLWLTHRVFNERLPAIISVLFKMRRGECGRNKQERNLYQRMARFFLAMDSKNADYLLNSIRNWTPNTALKMKATVRDAAGPADRGPTPGSSRGSKSNCRAGLCPAAPADRGKGNEKIGIVSPEFPEFPRIPRIPRAGLCGRERSAARARAEDRERTPKVGNHENMRSVPTFPAPAPLARRPASQGKEGTTEIGDCPLFPLFPRLRAAFPLRERRGS